MGRTAHFINFISQRLKNYYKSKVQQLIIEYNDSEIIVEFQVAYWDVAKTTQTDAIKVSEDV